MNKTDIFLEKLIKIEKELEQLGSEYSDIYKGYSGLEFKEQTVLAEDKLDNLILATTHEMATGIGLYRGKINNLIKYILFRQEFKNFTDDELKSIVDNQLLNSKEKIVFQKKTKGQIITELNRIKERWNELFKNKSYQKNKHELNL